MKKVINLLMLFSLSLILSCTEQFFVNEKEYPEFVEVFKITAYEEFVGEFNTFLSGLDVENRDLLVEFAEHSLSKPVLLSASCICQGEDRQCSASTWFSDCCICCPPPRAAVCGTIIGLVASCRCEDAPQPRLNNSEISSGNSKVIVYPRNIARFIKQAESYGVNTDKINNSFINFVKTLQ